MLFVHISSEASEELKTALRHASKTKWSRRLNVIQLSSQQTTVPELATRFDLCTATVRAYSTRYHADGLTGLTRASSDGAPPKIPLSREEWETLRHQSPAQFDRLHTGARNWTQALVVEYLQQYHDLRVTQPAGSLCLKPHKISWNRGVLKVTSPDPLYTVKRERIDTLKKTRSPAR